MTDQEINTAIAQHCGGDEYDTVPDYCHDLNAMHEVERYFDDKTEDEKSLYYDHLSLEMEIFPRNQEEAHWQNDWAILRSTARQRANAFVRTIGKWTE